MAFRFIRLVSIAISVCVIVTSTGMAQTQWAQSHVRLEYPAGQPVASMPVVTNLEPPSEDTAYMTSLGAKCNQVPPGNHKRWAVKMTIMPSLASQSVLTQAISHPYQVSAVVAAHNLSGQVSPVALDRSEAVNIAGNTFHEGDPIAVHGVILALGCEGDGDTHIDLASSLTSSTCLVVEVPNPKDFGAQGSQTERTFLTSMWTPLRKRFTEIYNDSGEQPTTPYDITVVGQLYFDTDHRNSKDPGGGRGIHVNGRSCARNLWEVHSVLDMTEQNH